MVFCAGAAAVGVLLCMMLAMLQRRHGHALLIKPEQVPIIQHIDDTLVIVYD